MSSFRRRTPIVTRRRRWLLGLLAVLVLAAGLLLLWPRPSAVTEENYGLIRLGMTLAEVETLLGGPAGHHRVLIKRIVQTRDDIDVPRLAEGPYRQWIDMRHMIGVQFDADDRVIGKDLGDVEPESLWRQPLVWLR